MATEDFARAVEFAVRCHEGQVRKDGFSPYIAHPLAVASRVLRELGDYDVASAAVLHDVIEDCGVTKDIIEDGWGPKVANLVDWVTERRNGEDPDAKNWRGRKEDYIAQLRFAPCNALLIALCDKLDNLTDLMRMVALDGSSAFKQLRVGKNSQVWYHDQLIPVFKEALLPGHVFEEYLFQVSLLRQA